MLKRKSSDVNSAHTNCSQGKKEVALRSYGSTSNSTQFPTLHLVVDTNIFLHRTGNLRDLICTTILGGKPPVLVVPWVVLQELDSMKANAKSELSEKAKVANSFISEMLMKEHPQVTGQSALDAVKEVSSWCPVGNDDKILHCCLQLRQKSPRSLVMLLSDDRNLCSKARVSYIKSYTWEDFVKKFRCAFGKQGGAVQKYVSVYRSKQTGVKYEQTRGLPEVISEIKDMLMDELVPILEKEVKEAYDDLWTMMFPVKPPWTLSDVFTCFLALWGGVFGLIFPRRLQETVKRLQQQFKQQTHCISASEATETLKLVEDLFLEIHKRYGKHGSCLPRITSWKESVKKAQRPPETASCTPVHQPVKRKQQAGSGDEHFIPLSNGKGPDHSQPIKVKHAGAKGGQCVASASKVIGPNSTQDSEIAKSRQVSNSVIKKQKVSSVPEMNTECSSNDLKKESTGRDKKQITHRELIKSTRENHKVHQRRKKAGESPMNWRHQPQSEKHVPMKTFVTRTESQVDIKENVHLGDAKDVNNILELFNYVWGNLNYLSGLALDCLSWPHFFVYDKPSTIPSYQEAAEFLPRLCSQLSRLEVSMKSALSSFSDQAMSDFLTCLTTIVPTLQNLTVQPANVDPSKLKSFCVNPDNRTMLQNGYNQLFGFLTATQQCLTLLKMQYPTCSS